MLTTTQQKIFEFIKTFIKEYQYSPTLAEIARGIGAQNRSLICYHVQALERAGFIDRLPGKNRQIRLKAKTAAKIPLLGLIAAGKPIEAISLDDAEDVVELLLEAQRSKPFALRVKGDSMIEEGIFDGDIVLCEQRDTAQTGEIIVALIDNHETTLKRFHPNKKAGTVTLAPANMTLKPQVYETRRIKIQGIFRGLIRLTR